MDIANKIKMLRTEILNISQDNFAKKIDVTRMTVKNWEEGLSKPTTSHITMIASLCNITTDYLIFDEYPLELSPIGITNEEYSLLLSVIKYFEEKNKVINNEE